MPIDRKQLPDDPEILARMVIDLSHQMDRMQGQLEYLTRQLFGRKSEKMALDSSQGRLYPPGESSDAPESHSPSDESGSTASDEATTPSPSSRPRKPRGERRSLPPSLPRVERHHVIESLGPCAHCGKAPERIAEKGDEAETFAYVPSSHYAIKDVTYTYACGCGETIVKSEAPMRPIIGGLPDAGALAHVLTSKYADHVPLNRQEEILRRQGIEISRSVLCGWVRYCHALLLPLYAALKLSLLELDYLAFDATHVKVQEKGRGRAHKGTMWAYRGGAEASLVMFEYTPTHNKDGPLGFLVDFKGYVQADAHPHYDPLFGENSPRTEVGCWSHARRPFVQIAARAKGESGTHARVVIAFIQQIFEVERIAKEQNLDAAGRLQLRQERSAPVMQKLRSWIDETLEVCMPRTEFGRAVKYLDRHWTALSRFLENGRLEIHNNYSEQELRKIALGRNNWIQFGNENGANWGALMFSLVASCRRSGVDPFLYFYDVLERISDPSVNQARDLLPDRWKHRFEAEAKAKIERARESLRHATVEAPSSATSTPVA